MTKEAVTAAVPLAARWLGPSATVTVTVAEPLASPTLDTVTAVPDTLTVTTPVSLDAAETAPSPALVTCISAVRWSLSSVTDAGERLTLPAALPMVQTIDFAPVVPSLHRQLYVGVAVAAYSPAFTADVTPPRVSWAGS